MAERNIRRGELAQELGLSSEHSQREIEYALSAFIDPHNPRMSLNRFFSQLTRMSIGSGKFGDMTEDDKRILEILADELNDVRDARLFNETYLGHLLSESSIPGLLGYILAMRIGSNTVARKVSLAESALEPEAIRGLMEIVGYDPKIGSGTFTSGGSMANMTALIIAREKIERDINTQGRTPGRMRVLTSPFAHYSIERVCKFIGGPSGLIELQKINSKNLKMSTTDLGQRIIDSQREGVPIMAVLAIAGETETGLVDPLNEIAEITESHGLNLIVDGTYGAPYRLSRVGEIFNGINRAWQ